MVKITIIDTIVTFEIKNNGIHDLKNFYTIEYFEFLDMNIDIFINTSKKIPNALSVPFHHFTNFVKDENIFIKTIKTPSFKLKKSKTFYNLNEIKIQNEKIQTEKIQTEKIQNNDDNDDKYDNDKYDYADDDKILHEITKSTSFYNLNKIKIQNQKIDNNHDDNSKFHEKMTKSTSFYNLPIKEENSEIITLKIQLDKNQKLQTLIEVMDENKGIYKDDIEMNSDGLFYDDIENILKIQKYIQMEIFQSEIYKLNGNYIVIKDNDLHINNFTSLDNLKIKDTIVTKIYT